MCPLPAGRGESGSVSVGVSKAEREDGRSILITVLNNRPLTIYLRGCNPYVFERKEGDAWVERHIRRCLWEGEALPIPSMGSREFEFPVRADAGAAGTYRVKVPYGCRCESASAGLSVSQLNCGTKREIYSEEFVIGSE